MPDDVQAIIISDQHLFVDLIAPILQQQGIWVIAQFDYVEPGLQFLKSHPVDVVFIDQIMPAVGGLEEDEHPDHTGGANSYKITLDAIVHIRQEHPGARIIAVAEDRDPFRCAQLLRAGAHGLVCKLYGLEECRLVMNRVLGGASLAVPEAMYLSLLEQLAHPASRLTKQEHKILRLVQRGLSNREIAKEVGTAPNTVRNYLVHIYKKLGVRTRIDAVTKAFEYGLLDFRY